METNKKVRVGHVIGNKMDKTVIVAIETLKRHPLYRKTLRKVV
jgi:small subunit ribosomal protein S17